MKTKQNDSQEALQLRIFGAPYGRDGESIGEAFSYDDAYTIAEANLTVSGLARSSTRPRPNPPTTQTG